MTRNKGRAMTVVSVLDDRQRVAAFVMLLLTADKQTAPNRTRSKKTKIKKDDNLVRQEMRALFLLVRNLSCVNRFCFKQKR